MLLHCNFLELCLLFCTTLSVKYFFTKYYCQVQEQKSIIKLVKLDSNFLNSQFVDFAFSFCLSLIVEAVNCLLKAIEIYTDMVSLVAFSTETVNIKNYFV